MVEQTTGKSYGPNKGFKVEKREPRSKPSRRKGKARCVGNGLPEAERKAKSDFDWPWS